MRYNYININNDWAILFVFNIGNEDVPQILSWLESLGANNEELRKSEEIVSGINKALTFSNLAIRMSIVCISNASSLEQWLDSLVHEIDHLQTSLCRFYDIELGSEDAAYIQGYLMRKILTSIKSSG